MGLKIRPTATVRLNMTKLQNKLVGIDSTFNSKKKKKKKINLTTIYKIPTVIQQRAVGVPGDRSVWEVLLHRVHIVITMLMGRVSLWVQPRWQSSNDAGGVLAC